MHASYSAPTNLVLTRKLSLSDKQRRKQLIASVATNDIKQGKKNSNSKIKYHSKGSSRVFGCFSGDEDTGSKSIDRRRGNGSIQATSSVAGSELDLIDSGTSYMLGFALLYGYPRKVRTLNNKVQLFSLNCAFLQLFGP